MYFRLEKTKICTFIILSFLFLVTIYSVNATDFLIKNKNDDVYFFVGSNGNVGIGIEGHDDYRLLVDGQMSVRGDLTLGELEVESFSFERLSSEKYIFEDGIITLTGYSDDSENFLMVDEKGETFSHGTPLDVVHGGTGLTTLTEHSLLVGNGMGNVNFIAPATTNPQRSVLISDGGEWKSLILAQDDIPTLSAEKFTSGKLNLNTIPELPASKITSGRFPLARLPSGDDDKFLVGGGDNTNPEYRKITEDDLPTSGLDAKLIKHASTDISINGNQIKSGTLDPNLIVGFSAEKITSGTLSRDLLAQSFSEVVILPLVIPPDINLIDLFWMQTPENLEELVESLGDCNINNIGVKKTVVWGNFRFKTFTCRATHFILRPNRKCREDSQIHLGVKDSFGACVKAASEHSLSVGGCIQYRHTTSGSGTPVGDCHIMPYGRGTSSTSTRHVMYKAVHQGQKFRWIPDEGVPGNCRPGTLHIGDGVCREGSYNHGYNATGHLRAAMGSKHRCGDGWSTRGCVYILGVVPYDGDAYTDYTANVYNEYKVSVPSRG